jgi:WD40 repeat protein
VALSPDGWRALRGERNRYPKLVDLGSGAEAGALATQDLKVTAFASSSDGCRALSGSEDGMLTLWSVESGEEICSFQGHTAAIRALAVTPDGRKAVSYCSDGMLKVWQLESGTEIRAFRKPGSFTAFAMTPDGSRVVSVYKAVMTLTDVDSDAEIRKFVGHSDYINAVVMAPDGRRFLSAADDRTVRLWDLESGQTAAWFEGDGAMTACAVLSDGVTVIAGDALGNVHFLRLEE